MTEGQGAVRRGGEVAQVQCLCSAQMTHTIKAHFNVGSSTSMEYGGIEIYEHPGT